MLLLFSSLAFWPCRELIPFFATFLFVALQTAGKSLKNVVGIQLVQSFGNRQLAYDCAANSSQIVLQVRRHTARHQPRR